MVFLVCVIVLIISQNLVSVGLAKLVGVSPLIGLSTGSIPMVGGHGTAGAFGPVLEDLGISGASTPVSYTHLDVYKRQNGQRLQGFTC